MLSQHHAIGLQTDCMVTVLAPVIEAARLRVASLVIIIRETRRLTPIRVNAIIYCQAFLDKQRNTTDIILPHN